YDDPYTTTKKDIKGYTFKEVKGKENGTFSDATQTVTYVYTANTTNNVPTPQKRPDDSQQSNGEKPKQPIDSSVGSEKNQEKKDPEPQKSKPEPQSKNQPAGSSSNGSSTNSDKNNNKKQSDANIAKKIITAGKQQIDRLLPKTGSQQTAGLTMIGTLLIFISSIIYFRKHK
ncbi:MucBP domain-containing protein, partial [Fructilactobacillus florum]|uniref:MucBP domain-containing protein n=1 Tax=Fructilactobacillus florum TaxID=640331 RepID=UPI00054FD92F